MTAALIGVLGGMGPAATVDLMQKIIQETAAGRDQDHVPVVCWNVPQIPDRQKSLAGEGESPLPAMARGIKALNAAGATHIVIPCNTAHHWFDDLQACSEAPIIHIASASVEMMEAEGNVGIVGILATRGTWQARLYQERLDARGITCITNSDDEMLSLFTPGCYAVKRGRREEGGALLERAGEALLARGATRLILACTEVPVGFDAIQSRLSTISIDSNRALARACVREWQASFGALQR
ncbi:cysteate racemase [Noviherbaspirillum galbum]|uniref:Aspartate/glutamate racemase family protein n=1 Tax=Noviherbaspirillum galbum TaxID=2709383 RepID=A0A6B3SMH8_9BURK|nr:amino acid racemase [Noviherbaspirillum galbum]NEX59582.1 aspartate/glutamate racemase family protein [Noviherbaspirillum galbum]